MEIYIYIYIHSVHIPLFFFVAGCLCHKQPLTKYFKKKIFRILVPYVTFAIFKLIYTNLISNEFAHASTLQQQIFDAFINGNLYWFVYSIFLMYCIAPVFWEKENRLSSQKNIYIFISLVIMNTIITFICGDKLFNIKILQFGKTLFYLVFFLAGIICNQNKEKISKVLKYKHILMTLSVLVTGILSYIIITDYTKNIFPIRFLLAFSLIYLLMLFARLLPLNIKFLKIIGKYSLQLMFFDSFFKVILFAVIGNFLTINVWIAVLISIINIILGCILSMIIEKIPYIKTIFGL